jgi:hypothetical protein
MPKFIKTRVILIFFLFAIMSGTMLFSIAYRAIPACDSDDGSGPVICKWEAQTMGNGEGTSFVSINL